MSLKRRIPWEAAPFGMLGAFFAADWVLPLGIAGGILHVGAVLVSARLPGSRSTYLVAGIAVFLTIVGSLLSPPGGAPGIVVVNRALAVLAIGFTALLVSERKVHAAQLLGFARRQSRLSSVRMALDNADEEAEAVTVCGRAIETIAPRTQAQILLADNSRGHLRRAFSNAGSEGCAVESPMQCPAVRRATSLKFDDPAALDACPRLSGRAEGKHALCSPINVAGQCIGVLHLLADPKETDADPSIFDVMTYQLGNRLGTIRTLTATMRRAETDALTGLLNRQSFLDQATSILKKTNGPHAVAIFDLDDFKRLNDEAGHADGDRALQVFSEVLRKATRPTDILGRYGGEEFAVLISDCDTAGAMATLGRVSESLARACQTYGGPAFTTSAGLAVYPADAEQLRDLIRVADRLLYEAKSRGKNRFLLAEDLLTRDPERPGRERRCYPRSKWSQPATLSLLAADATDDGMTQNVSRSGVLIRCRHEYTVGERVRLAFRRARDQTVRRVGSAVRSVPQEDGFYAVAFVFEEPLNATNGAVPVSDVTTLG